MNTLLRSLTTSAIALLIAGLLQPELLAQKLQVFVLSGQSNMQGHAKVSTFDYIGEDEETADLLKEMTDANGKPRVCEDVWISYLTGSRDGNGEGTGKLTAGFGARRDPAVDGGKIGPEFTFGLRMARAIEGPILIIKTAWGGKSLHTDFRPPSAGPYVFNEAKLEQLASSGKDVDQVRNDKLEATGQHYRLMIEHVQMVLADIERVCPAYDPREGYELAGFVWFQGWNDMVDRGTYPNRDQPGGYRQYSECLAHLIRDVRKDLAAPGMPFVIGVMGVGGPLDPARPRNRTGANFRAAMAAPAELPEFEGSVVAVPTAPYWDAELGAIAEKRDKVKNMARMLRTKNKKHANKDGTMSDEEQKAYLDRYRAEVVGAEDEARFARGASNAGYHYLGCAKTMAGIGVAFADAIVEMR